MYDVLIVGAGPAGLACALEAKARGLSYVVLEKGAVVNAIIGFPVSMTFFSTPDLLEIGGIPFTSVHVRPSRIETIEYYRRVVERAELDIELGVTVLGGRFDAAENCFRVATSHGERCARHVVIATGYFDNVNRLDVPGEDLPKVSHYYHEPFAHFRRDVLVIGGRNSAVETALDLYRHGARVTLVHRGEELGRSVKYWVRPDMENRIAKGEIAVRWTSRVTAITETTVELENITTGERASIANDAVYAMIGHRPDVRLLDAFGVGYDGETLVPSFDPATFETNVPGLFIAGSVACGARTWEIFIENGRQHAAAVIRTIAGA